MSWRAPVSEKNLFTYHNDYRGMGVTLDVILGKRAPYQIDASMGLTSAIIEMMMSSTSDALRSAPCNSKALDTGENRHDVGTMRL